MLVLSIIITVVSSYLLGSMNGAIIASKYYYKKDIREYGSGNPGLTNFYRVFGKFGAIVVVIIDVMKTVIPVVAGGILFENFVSTAVMGRTLAGFCVMLGHVFPIFYKFKGGKGVLTGGVVVFIVDWRVGLVAWGAFLILVILTRYVSLGSIAAGVMYPVAMALFGVGGNIELLIVILSGSLLIARHAPNIYRLVHGKESKLTFKK